VAAIRTRPLIAVISRVPLLVEALTAAFAGIADLQAVSADDVEAHGLVRAFRPDAVIVESTASDIVDAGIPCVRLDLDTQRVSIREGAGWRDLQIDLSPESIRNVLIARLYGGELL